MNRVYLLLIILLSWPALAGEQPPSPLFVVHIETGPAWRSYVPPGISCGLRARSESDHGCRSWGEWRNF